MNGSIFDILDDSPEDMIGEVDISAYAHLFHANEYYSTDLDKKTTLLFHHIVAQLIFMCKCAQPDIQTDIVFLCTRLQSPNTVNYKNLTILSNIYKLQVASLLYYTQ